MDDVPPPFEMTPPANVTPESDMPPPSDVPRDVPPPPDAAAHPIAEGNLIAMLPVAATLAFTEADPTTCHTQVGNERLYSQFLLEV
jgi:hypothetical protein